MFGDMDFSVIVKKQTFGTAITQTFSRSVSTVKMVVDSLVGLLNGRFGLDAMSGPIGVAEVVGEAAKNGLLSFLYIVTVLSINLGVFNLIPFPALDGGRFFFLIIEGIRRKPLNKDVEAYINFIGIILLLGLMIFISFKDILKLFFR
jgi:regulator of sigma E protease